MPRSFFILFLLIWPCLAGLVRGAVESASPYQVKAAFLYNFIKFIEWPPQAFETPASPYVVGILGKDPFEKDLETAMQGKIINGRKIVVQRITDEDLLKCHLVFISNSERRRIPEIVNQVRFKPVVTVGESDGFAEQGGVINFFVEENKIRFQINIEAAKQADLKIHSTLLNLARIVRSRS